MTLPAARFLARRTVLGGFLALGAGSADAAARPAPIVTVLGDSITAGLGLPAAAALPAQLHGALGKLGVNATVRGAGVSGDTTGGGLARVDFSVQPDTTLCVIELGANDYLQSVPVSETRRNLTALIDRLKARKIRVVLCGGGVALRASGSYGREFNALFPMLAKAEHVSLAPDLLAGVIDNRALVQGDGLHPNAAGVRVLAGRLSPVVAKALAG
jgi:acyl-CoA thioesterase-1